MPPVGLRTASATSCGATDREARPWARPRPLRGHLGPAPTAGRAWSRRMRRAASAGRTRLRIHAAATTPTSSDASPKLDVSRSTWPPIRARLARPFGAGRIRQADGSSRRRCGTRAARSVARPTRCRQRSVGPFAGIFANSVGGAPYINAMDRGNSTVASGRERPGADADGRCGRRDQIASGVGASRTGPRSSSRSTRPAPDALLPPASGWRAPTGCFSVDTSATGSGFDLTAGDSVGSPARRSRGRDSEADVGSLTQAGLRIVTPVPSVVALVGPSGSGKSTFARQHFAAAEIFSSDAWREALTRAGSRTRASAARRSGPSMPQPRRGSTTAAWPSSTRRTSIWRTEARALTSRRRPVARPSPRVRLLDPLPPCPALGYQRSLIERELRRGPRHRRAGRDGGLSMSTTA